MKHAWNVIIVIGLCYAMSLLWNRVQAEPAKKTCPPTQPGLILRDLEHPPSSRPVDREYIVLVGNGVLQPGINRSQAEALAFQLNKMFPALKFTARPQIAIEAGKP